MCHQRPTCVVFENYPRYVGGQRYRFSTSTTGQVSGASPTRTAMTGKPDLHLLIAAISPYICRCQTGGITKNQEGCGRLLFLCRFRRRPGRVHRVETQRRLLPWGISSSRDYSYLGTGESRGGSITAIIDWLNSGDHQQYLCSVTLSIL